MITCAGESFASRVGASLLTSIGLPDLIATSTPQYESLAVALAADGLRLVELKRRMAERRHSSPLFDIRTYTKNLESGYLAVLERHHAGLPPEDIDVRPGLDADDSARSDGAQDLHFER
jgi:predicted O-linked N-acetylglucosamine transferase (SPINDLY family)